MRKIRGLSILLCFTLLISMFPVTALAGTSASVWDGSSEPYTLSNTEQPNSESNPYIIDTAAKLAYLSYMVNGGTGYSGQYFQLTNDLDLRELSWIPIGYDYDKPFNGIFDGNDHLIDGLSVNRSAVNRNEYAGLFGAIRNGSIIKNLNVSGSVTQQLSYYAAASWAGGIVGYAIGESESSGQGPVIDNCSFYGNVTAIGIMNIPNSTILSAAGGIVGRLQNRAIVSNCNFGGGNILSTTEYTSGNAYAYAGGIAGQAYVSEIVNSYSNGSGNISATNSLYHFVGGILGGGDRTDVSSCYNVAEVSTASGIITGGIAGNLDSLSTVDYSYWNEDCNAAATVGNRDGESGKMTLSAMEAISFRDILNDNLDAIADLSLYKWQQTEGGLPTLSDTLWTDEPDVITDLVIEDAIAPITGGTPADAIAETDQYTGTLTWTGSPVTFAAGTTYTATLTLSPKTGYTLTGIVENAFSVPAAYTDTNAADSGVITLTFISPPVGYTTDGHGVMAYRYDGLSQVDVGGFRGGDWLQTTYGNGGYRFYYILGLHNDFADTSTKAQLYLLNAPITIPGTALSVQMLPSFTNGGKAVKLTYRITNGSADAQTLSFAGGSDVQIGGDDGAPMERLVDDRGFKMYSGDNQFNFFGLNTVGVTNVDTFWFGTLRELYSNFFNQQTTGTISGVDSAMAYSWKNKVIAPGQTRNFSVLIGIGGAGSEVPVELGILFDSQGGSEVTPVEGLASGDTAAAPTSPIRSGYSFSGWYTEPECTNLFSFATPITATITLYAKWTENAPVSSGSSAPPKYSVKTNDSQAETGGALTFSSMNEKAGNVIKITGKPDAGFESGVPTVLDKDGKQVELIENGDGTFSFKMPQGGVTVSAEFKKIDYFDDVNEKDWFDEASWYCAANGLMEGTGERKFDANKGTNRAMLVMVLYRLSKSDNKFDIPFADVDKTKWYSDAIAWAAHNKIVEGYGNDKFGPNDMLTREQIVSILYRYLVYMKYDVGMEKDLDSIKDANQVSGWAMDGMKWAVGNGIIQGIGNGRISPDSGATRDQFAAIIQRFHSSSLK